MVDSCAARVVARYVVSLKAPKPEDFEKAADACLAVHTKLQKYLDDFDAGLVKAVEKSSGLPAGRVWAKYVSDLWDKSGGYSTIRWKQFPALSERMDALDSSLGIGDAANMIRSAVTVPQRLQIETVMKTVQHHDEAPEGEGKNWAISYDVGAVHKWRDDLLGWSKESEATIKQAIKKGKAALRKRKPV